MPRVTRPEDLAVLISSALGKELLAKIKNGEARASDLQVALNFVKYNQVRDGDNAAAVADSLKDFNFPFTSEPDSDRPN